MKNLKLEFRAWDGKKMHQYNNSVLVLGTKHTIYHQPVGKGEFLVSKMCTTQHGGVIMQSTGAEDKNGKPIYDGDILSEMVECDGEMVPSKEVVFYNSQEFMWCVDLSLKQDGSYYSPLRELMLSKYEIIGNRYQNEELLKSN